jgi:hypothetical protein
MGLYKRYNDTALLTRLDNVESSITDIVTDNDSQAQSLVTLFQADIDQNAINRVYLRREKSGNGAVPFGTSPVNIQYDYQVQANLKDMISTSDAVTFTFNGNGVFLINTVVSMTDLVMPADPLRGYCIIDMVIGGGQKLRRLCADHPNGNIGNLSLQGSTVLIASAGTTFRIQATIVDSGTILGQVPQARTYLEIFQL